MAQGGGVRAPFRPGVGSVPQTRCRWNPRCCRQARAKAVRLDVPKGKPAPSLILRPAAGGLHSRAAGRQSRGKLPDASGNQALETAFALGAPPGLARVSLA